MVKPKNERNDKALQNQPKTSQKETPATSKSSLKQRDNLALMSEKNELSDVFAKRNHALKVNRQPVISKHTTDSPEANTEIIPTVHKGNISLCIIIVGLTSQIKFLCVAFIQITKYRILR